jgi:tol-pal system protein YbgF
VPRPGVATSSLWFAGKMSGPEIGFAAQVRCVVTQSNGATAKANLSVETTANMRKPSVSSLFYNGRHMAASLVIFGAAMATATVALGQDAKGGDAALKSRVQTLEEQLVDMQVVVGTLESLAKSGGGTAYRGGGGGSPADAGRLDALENQIRALSVQLQQVSEQVRSLSGGERRGDAAAPAGQMFGDAPAPAGNFGATTITTRDDPIGGLLADAPPQGGSFGGTPPPVSTAALPPPGGGEGNPKQLYETAYGYLLQRDYGAAEVAFNDFLSRFPNDSLSGNAQYWLGETYFVRGQYKAAASAFLKGYQTYGQSSKAPDSLLKLAMSLDRLGQKDAACTSYNELNTRFPNAPQSVRSRAQSERQRVGCT